MKKDMKVLGLEIGEVKGQLLALAKEFLPVIREAVLEGRRITMQEVQLIKMIMGKVVPDVSASSVVHSGTEASPIFLSREDLERLVSAQSKALEPITHRFDTDVSLNDPNGEGEVACQERVTRSDLPLAFVTHEHTRNTRNLRGRGVGGRPADALAGGDPECTSISEQILKP